MRHSDEAIRSDALRRYEILNTPPEPNFDRITRLASEMLDHPICTLALADLDRFWFKSRQGVEATEMPRSMAFCEQTIGGDGVFIVTDARQDVRFVDAPVVKGLPHIRFYAGAPLVTPDGVRIGSLCVLDPAPKFDFSPKSRGVLVDLASTAVELFEARARQIELARCTEQIAHLARHDPLTGLPNRRRLAELYDQISLGRGGGVALLYLDLDGFKAVNDRRGHACGDAVLRQVADRIRAFLPPGAFAARIGGDEFAVVMPAHPADLRGLSAALGRLLVERIGRPYESGAQVVRIGCSAGIAVSVEAVDLQDLLSRADAAMYWAKDQGRNRCVFADDPAPIERFAS